MSMLQVPAMRGAIGDWVYYVTLLPFHEVISRIKKTEEIHNSKLLREMIQRALTPRSKTIAQYLKSHRQHFFNAIVVGVYDGAPEWHGLSVRKSDQFDPVALQPQVAESLGILTLRGDEKLFAIDGQHRVEGIKEFGKEIGLDKLHELEDEVCALFVSHSSDPAGLQRTRRLFATLNRYAKPVSLAEIIALDEDDVVAIACRDLLERHPLFKTGRVSLDKRKSLAPSDRTSFTSLISLYQSLDIYLADRSKKAWGDFKSVRPQKEGVVEKYISKSHEFWNILMESIPELRTICDLDADKLLPASFRGSQGGDLLFRPIALPLISRAYKKAAETGMTYREFVKRFAKIPRSLNKFPWRGVLWDGTAMTVREKNQQLTEHLILWMIDCKHGSADLISADSLREKLSKVLNKPELKCKLPRKFV